VSDQEREALKEIAATSSSGLRTEDERWAWIGWAIEKARAALTTREEPPESALLDAAKWVLDNWDRNATQHASIPALRAAVQTASATREEPPEKYAICQCGHLAYWHSAVTREGDVPQGAGSCEEKPDCRCERFVAREDTERPDADPVVSGFVGGLEARIVRANAERDARLTFAEARDRTLDAIKDARQALYREGNVVGDLLGDDPDTQERLAHVGVNVIALKDFNDALDRAFPVRDTEQEPER